MTDHTGTSHRRCPRLPGLASPPSIRIPRAALGPLLVLLLAGAIGCGPPLMGPVSGRVTFKGKPVPMAVVCFQPRSRQIGVGVTDNDGRYRLSSKKPLDGAYGGRHAVSVYPWQLAVGQEPLDPAYTPPPEDRTDIPSKYRTPHTSPLSADVVAGRENTIDLDLAP
jgi:hypothetical protein